MIKSALRSFLLFTFFFVAHISLSAQTKDALPGSKKADTVKTSFVARMQEFARKEAKESARDFENDKAILAQHKILDEVKKTMQVAKSYLRTGVDTTGARAQLIEIEENYKTAVDGVLTNKGTAQTFRNVTATSKILKELLGKAQQRKVRLDMHQQQLNTFRYQLDSLLNAPSLFKFSTDSAVLIKYLQQLGVVAYEVHPIDSALKRASNNVQGLLNQVNMQVFKLQTSSDEIAQYQLAMANNTFKREFGNIWEPASNYRPFDEIIDQASKKGMLTLYFYAENNLGKLAILCVLILTSFIYLRSLKQIYIEKELLNADMEGQLVLRYPLFSALLIVINMFQFMFPAAPFILNVIFWLIACVSLTILFYKFITRYWMNIWLIMVGLFLITAFDNLILQASRAERWFMLLVSITGFIVGTTVLFRGKKEELREKLILISIGFMAFLELASTLANLYGRYNLSKTLLISGFLNVVIAILFLWTIRLINEGLFLAFSVYTRQDKKLFYLNFDRVGTKVPPLFYFLLIAGWIVLFGRNFAGFDYIAEPLRDFFSRSRTIGDYTFSINNLLLFIVIMAISVIISKVVSFFASDKSLTTTKSNKQEKQGLGSWLLLIRISILAIGLFLAVAAAGIPVDRITIVLGALGVGIGFGLQTLVNNLVSGLIIAFEKPVNVGDVVDVSGQGGIMKSIGFRSSIISTWEGADMVMPNGDLLNSHLMNWSLAGNRKRMSIAIGISYDADLEKCRQLLNGILDAEERVSKYPAAVVQYEQFGSSAIDVKIHFWTKHIAEAYATKSDLIIVINTTLKENGITIPFPRQDVHYQPIDPPNSI
ncbi:mechanosensitive ion channel family protein [Pedobacter duraquae]|uniref:Mechanosensitive ion channel-like protein n=1 Tax=Pedobacter duraquae TaxID=425511 RepID=A0A4R6IPQ4_9SPHI|nr:mechanosensitive ion channel domain-containing protein [Pedobacter duraquae]TDO23986.1 mechanosensitive ion channel-like protein [Pedobacter duraquae]